MQGIFRVEPLSLGCSLGSRPEGVAMRI